jgi:hypothetical protein
MKLASTQARRIRPTNSTNCIKAMAVLTLFASLAGCAGGLNLADAAQHKANQERYAKAKALFEERCKTAGVVIKHTVKEVDGIELKKIRRDTPWGGKEYFDPMWEDAALAGTNQGDEFIKDFLLSEVRLASHPENRFPLRRPERKAQPGELPMRPGYRFVEYVDPADGLRYRYRLPFISGSFENSREGALARERSTTAPLRYAFTYEGLVDPADRALWIAGVRLKAIDQKSGEVLAEMTRYVFDPGFGVSTTDRWPWQSTHTNSTTQCPSSSSEPLGHAHRHFIDTVLIPKRGD